MREKRAGIAPESKNSQGNPTGRAITFCS